MDDETPASEDGVMKDRRVRFSVIGLNHNHIYGQVEALMSGGGELVSFFAVEPELSAAFTSVYPQARPARCAEEILDDDSIQLIASASIPADRAALGIAAMQHGKDFMSDKPGFTTLGQLDEARRVQAATGRIYSIYYSERLGHPATVKAGELVKAGAIGRVVQTVGLGPHLANPGMRPEWFFRHERYGGIITDIGSHQCDQFLFFTGSTEVEVVSAQVGNVHHPQYPELEDYGDVVLTGNGGTGYIRVDWLTPQGLGTWGDGRLIILGTDGFVEVRKNCDLARSAHGNHLFLANHDGTTYLDCSQEHCPYGAQLIADVINRTETAMSQRHCFLASEAALLAQSAARRLLL
jgi:predicted dehydrogenase